jgi:hypothetical protein
VIANTGSQASRSAIHRLEGRCVTRETTPEQLTAQIAALLETLLHRNCVTVKL